ncbi:uncharacterized protein H6S33_004663 [Morchella sextelata]|uniref:uncharacterized protein n=1 Tax=Morchella sextelata TaxID=1174677 RepID=UPI001D0383E1|nr:uncharacterized protein H6S33_004663 [Morchella sextelata]KAH0605441.1 hypothetical protein H6S33_004663 [Morchella sextelata]
MGINLPYTYARFIDSEIFTLFAGQSRKPFHVHKQLLAEISPALKSHVFNDMKEGRENCMEMEHVTPQTMCQFLEFCYTGEYSEFADDIIDGDGTGEEEEQEEQEEQEEAEVDRREWDAMMMREVCGEVFVCDTEPKIEPRVGIRTLVPHAKLYVLGDMYNIPRLKSRAYWNINEMIEKLENRGRSTWVADVYVDLVRYACDNLPERAGGGGVDPLVEYLAGCAACKLGSLCGNKRFLELLSTGGREDFTRAFLERVKFRDGATVQRPDFGE